MEHLEPDQHTATSIVDCWNTVGVRGDGSCVELARHVHCRNCPVHSRAAMALLDREPPGNYVAASTAHFAQPQAAPERDTQSVVVFRIGAEWLALPTSVVMEIGHLRQIHSLPQRHGHVVGVVNVHGELVVCVSLARVLGLNESPAPARHAPLRTHARLIVIRREAMRTVCPVDEVYGIHGVQQQQLRDVPATVAKSASTYAKHVLSWREHAVGLLDDQLLFQALKRSLA